MRSFAWVILFLLFAACAGSSTGPSDAGSNDAGTSDAGTDAGSMDAGPVYPFITCYGAADIPFADGGYLPDGGYCATQFTTEVAYLPQRVQTGTYCVYQRAATDGLALYSHHICFDVANQPQASDGLISRTFQIEVGVGEPGFETSAFQTYEIELPAGVDPSAIDDGGLGGGQLVDMRDVELNVLISASEWGCLAGFQP